MYKYKGKHETDIDRRVDVLNEDVSHQLKWDEKAAIDHCAGVTDEFGGRLQADFTQTIDVKQTSDL